MQQLHGSKEPPTGMPGHRLGYAISCFVRRSPTIMPPLPLRASTDRQFSSSSIFSLSFGRASNLMTLVARPVDPDA